MNPNLKEKQQTVKLRGLIESNRGKIIDALQQDVIDPDSVIYMLLSAWYLPFTVESDDPQLQAIALQSVGLLEGRAKAIREYIGNCEALETVQGSKSHQQPLELQPELADSQQPQKEAVSQEFDALIEQLGV